MVDTLENKAENFFLENSGISVIASEVSVKKKKVSLVFPPGTGIVNGGHTQLAILNVKARKDISEAIVKLEVIEKVFPAQDLAVIAASRNTASNVKPYSIAEKRGLYFEIKRYLDSDFEKHIIWYENRDVPNDKGWPAPDLIAVLNLFDVKSYQSNFGGKKTEQPNKSATSKNAVFSDWQRKPDQLSHVYPLVNDIIRLQELIQSTFNKNAPRGFTTLKVLNHNDPPKKTLFLGRDVEYTLPKQFLLPILASMRADVFYDESNNKIGWFEEPKEVFVRCKKTLITDLMNTFRSTYHNEINQASKDSNLWRILYLDVDNTVSKKSPWRTYDAP
jgi:hypothetical protein